MYIATIIPGDVLGRVREGARCALLEPVAKLGALAEHDPQHARSPYTNELLAQIGSAVGLLHAIGWSTGDAVPETAIDIGEYGPALCEALSEAMRVATVELKDAGPRARRRVSQSVLPLSTFAAVVEAACLERAGRDPGVHVFQEDLQVFLGELERDGRDTSRPDGCTSRLPRRPYARRGFQDRCSDQTR
jgi:hypothetical protein